MSSQLNMHQSLPRPKPLSRSKYADRLQECGEFVFGGFDTVKRRSRWQSFFKQRIGAAFDGKIIVDIGCFDAEFLTRIAGKFPKSGFVGLDWKAKALYDGGARIAALGLQNIALLHARGQDLPVLFGENEVDELWIFHPDPFDKENQLNQRLISAPWLSAAHGVLRNEASIVALKTDHPEYYRSAVEFFAEGNPLRRLFDVAMTSSDYWHDHAALAHTAGRYFQGETTGFETRFRNKRMPIHYLELQKRSAQADLTPR